MYANGNDDSDKMLWSWLEGKLSGYALSFSKFRVIKRGSVTVGGKPF